MDKQNLMPNQAQPVNRNTTGQLPSELAELSEEVLEQQGSNAFGASVQPSDWILEHKGKKTRNVETVLEEVNQTYKNTYFEYKCTFYDGDDAE